MRPCSCRSVRGFTLVEMMIVVAIISILAAVAIPNFVAYRAKSKISAVLGEASAIRAGLSSYAADNPETQYPATTDITTYDDLRTIINANGGSFPPAAEANFTLVSYERFDRPAESSYGLYALRVAVKDTPNTFPGFEIVISPQGVFRCATSAPSC